MEGDNQEHFEDYLELERFLADLQAGRPAPLPQQLTPDRARIYRMALLFHAAIPGTDELRPEFAAYMRLRLEEELQTPQEGHQAPRTHRSARTAPAKKRVTRRMLLAGGATVAASVAVGAGSEWLVEQGAHRREPQGTGSPMNWFFVTTVAELGNQAVKFVSQDLIGYLVRSDGTNGDPADRGRILALAAACTHQGCLVQWTSTDRTFRCPCHGAVFTEDGETHTRASAHSSLKPLARLEVRVTEGEIYVRVPA